MFKIYCINYTNAEAKYLLSGEKATLRTHEPCPDNVLITSPDGTSYSVMWQSSEAVTRYLQSGENVSDLMGIAWPSSVVMIFPVSKSKSLIIPSIAPLAICFPSGLWSNNYNKYGMSLRFKYEKTDKFKY